MKLEPRQPMQSPKKSNKKLVIGIILALLCIAAVTAFFLLRETPEERIDRYLDLGAKYIEEEDYESAIAAYDSALEIDPNLEEAIEGEINTYLAWSDVLVAEEDFDEALDILEEGYDKFDDDRLLQAIERVEAAQEVADIHEDIIDLIYEATELCEGGDYLAVAELLADNVDILSQMNEAGVDRYLYDDLSVCSAGIYIIGDDYYLYVGDYENGNREGNGTWVSIYHMDYDGFAYAIGDWSDDVPNGQQVVTSHHGEIVAEVNFTRGIEGKVVDGVWDGPVVWFFGDDNKFAVDFDNGIVDIMYTDNDTDDDSPYHVGDSMSGDEDAGDLVFGQDDISATWGIPGYADEW